MACGILVFPPRIQPVLPVWKFRVLTSGPPGKSLSSFKKERDSVTCYNMDKPWGYYEKGNKPATKRQTFHDSTNARYFK